MNKAEFQAILDRNVSITLISGGEHTAHLQDTLVNDLGYRVFNVIGYWDGVEEESLLVEDLPPAMALHLGQTYNQEAVLVTHKYNGEHVGVLYYSDGRDPEGLPPLVFLADGDELPLGYTDIDGLKFTFG